MKFINAYQITGRNRPRRPWIGCLLTCWICLGAWVQAPPAFGSSCAVRAEVIDGDQRPVAGAVVHLMGAELSFTSDARGEVCVPELDPGSYGLLVIADGFSVLDGKLTRADLPVELTLELTPAFGEELVVTGTRTTKRLADSPVHVQRIGRQSIEAAAARTLADAIEMTPGVRIESNCQNCNFSQIRMLGLEGPYSQILVDGLPTVSSLALVYGIEQFPARLLDSVEVVKGGGAAIYGPGAVGGVINLIPHAPFDTHATLEARTLETGGEAGHTLTALADWSPADRRTGLSILGQTDSVGAADLDGDGFTEVTERRLDTLAARAEGYVLDDSARWHGEVNWTDAFRRGGDSTRIDQAPENTELTEQIETRRLGLAIGYLHTVSPRFDYRLGASYSHTRRDSYYGGGFDPNAYGDTVNPLWIVDGQSNLYLDHGTVTAGAQYSRDRVDDRQPGYGRFLNETHTNWGLYLQEDRRLGRGITLVYGLRADDHSALSDAVLSPRLALMAALRDDLTLRISYAHGFRAPVTFDEDLHIELAAGTARVTRPAQDLAEERSEAQLASLEWRPTFGRKGSASLEIAAFRTDLDQLFNVVERDDPTTPEREFLRVNAEGARVEGLELTASVRWGSRLSLQAGWVSQRSRFQVPEPDFGSLDFFRTPEQHGTITLQIQPTERLGLYLGGRYTGSMIAPHYAGFIDQDRLETTPSFFELDFNVSRDFTLRGRTLTLTVGGKNLTDAYQDDLDRGPDRDSNYVYGPRLPRSYQLGLRWRL